MKLIRNWWRDFVSLVVAVIVFVVPFVFIFLMAGKTQDDASDFRFSWPKKVNFLQNFKDVAGARDGLLFTGFKNSTLLTLFAVTGIVLCCSMAAFVLQRRPGKVGKIVDISLLIGLMVPPAVVPTIWVLQRLHIFKTLFGLVLVEIAFGMSFAVLIFRGFIASIPRELDEAALMDGCTGISLFFRVIFPLLRPVTITIILVSSVFIFNDFVNPLYFLPGAGNETVQTTLFTFVSNFSRYWNLLFMDMLVITIPPLILFAFFNRKIVAGLTGGAVKG